MAEEKLYPLPPLHALRSFHAAAQFGRFRDAASALGLSESAVSHQVRKLEDYLGVQLFERNANSVRLTMTGEAYFAEISPALARIRKATQDLSGPCCRVALTMTTSLATTWFIPRLAKLEAALPEINVQLVPTGRVVDLRREQIDLGIRYGLGRWPGLTAHHLFDEQAFPVCRPGMVDADADPQTALRDNRLILNGPTSEEWREWAEAHALAAPSLSGALELNGTDQVLEAAGQGLGLAIGRRPMVDWWLDEGRLVAPFGSADESGCAYFLIYPDDGEITVPARRLARWLMGICKGEEAAHQLKLD